MQNSRKVNNTTIWWLRKTNETNYFKVKTWGGFNLTILKVKQIHYKRIEVFTIIFNSKSIATFNSNLLTRPRANFQPSNTSTHAYDFEIPLKSLATQTLQFVNSRPPLKV